LFTLHALWPFLWIWAMAYRPERGWGFSDAKSPQGMEQKNELEEIQRRLAQLETKIGTGGK
jgi:hypothetical protein